MLQLCLYRYKVVHSQFCAQLSGSFNLPSICKILLPNTMKPVTSIFLSPNFLPNFAPFATRLKDAGVCVLGLGDDPYEVLREELKSGLTEYYKVSDLHNYDELVRAMGYFTHRYGKLDHLDSHNEYWLETEARLRTDFNIDGIDTAQIDRVKRKSQMKSLFLKAGLRPARGRVCRNAEELKAFIAEVGYPVVAKPDIGVGAAKTFKLTSDADLPHFWQDKYLVDYIVEEFVSGQIVTYDGLTDRNGKVIFSSSLRYSNGVMEVVNADLDIYYHTVREIEPKLEKAGKAVLDAFNLTSRFFHIEFFFGEKGEVIPLEINIRPPGGLTINMMNYTFDADIYSTWAKLIATGQTELPGERKHFVVYVGRKDRILYKYSHHQVLEQFGGLMLHHERLDDVFSLALGNHGYLLRHTELEPLVEAANSIQRRA